MAYTPCWLLLQLPWPPPVLLTATVSVALPVTVSAAEPPPEEALLGVPSLPATPAIARSRRKMHNRDFQQGWRAGTQGPGTRIRRNSRAGDAFSTQLPAQQQVVKSVPRFLPVFYYR
jgi:hypothetical protein